MHKYENLDFEIYLKESAKKYETLGDFVYFNYSNRELMKKLVKVADYDLMQLLNKRRIRKSLSIYLALVYIQMENYYLSFWKPVRECLNVYGKTHLSEQYVDGFIRDIIDVTHEMGIEEINRQSIKVQFDSGFSFPHLNPLYEICYDYYYKDLKCGLTESEFLDEAAFLLEVLKHKFSTESFEEDEITINSTVYSIIKSTKLRIMYSNDIMLDLLREILRLIDSSFWESIEYKGNHFIMEHYKIWAKYYLAIKKKLLNDRSFKYKENTEHIVRKPNLYLDKGEIYFKVPDQKIKEIDESKKTVLVFFFDGVTKTVLPSITRQMIGYQLTGGKVKLSNPFKIFGYIMQTGGITVYENKLDLQKYYLFNNETGSRLYTLKNFIGQLSLITKPNINVLFKNTNVITSITKGLYTMTILNITENSVLSIGTDIISSYDENESGILIDSIQYIKLLANNQEYKISNKKPLVIIPEDYSNSRLSININGKHYDDLNNKEISKGSILYDFESISFNTGIYNIDIHDMTQQTNLYSISFYYDRYLKVTLNKDIYFSDEQTIVTITKDGETFNRTLTKKSNKIIRIEQLGFGFIVNPPYIYWNIKDYKSYNPEVFLENLPSRFILETKYINEIIIPETNIPLIKSAEISEFDLSLIYNIQNKNEVSVRANTSRGNVFLFKIYLKNFIDESKCIIDYDEDEQTFNGEVDYTGIQPIDIIIKSDIREAREKVTNNRFKVKFPLDGIAKISFVQKVRDEFGLFGNNDIILYTKTFKYISPKNLLNRVLVSNKKLLKGSKKSKLIISVFNVRIVKLLGNNNYYGKAFIPNHYGGIIDLPKYDPVRVEFMTNNSETDSSSFKIYFKDGEEIFTEWVWSLDLEDNYEKRKI